MNSIRSFRKAGAMRLYWFVLAWLVLAGCESSPSPASYHAQDFDVRVGGTVKRVKGAAVSSTFFSAQKTQPVLGRGFLPDENGPLRVAVISYRFWNDEFHADSAAVTSTLQVNGQDVTIVGVMPKGFAVPNGADLWVPLR
jgi:hypothetical protein